MSLPFRPINALSHLRAQVRPLSLTVVATGLALTGCQSPPVLTNQRRTPEEAKAATTEASQRQDVFTVQNGDTLRVGFPGSPNLDTSQQIRPDGRITMPIIGEVVAAGKTPLALEKELVAAFSPHLVSKEVTVTVVSAAFSVFISGAVQKPGKITSDRPITALEAIMEAGGFDNAKADMAHVAVVRQGAGKTEHFTINLKQVLEGKSVEPFYLRRSDIIHVPEKFKWF